MDEATRGVAVLICGPGLVACVAACMLSRFVERDASWLSFLSSVAGVTIAFSILAVVPYDVWQAVSVAHGHQQVAAKLLRSSWVAMYWTTSLLSYLVCPVLMEFEASADFSNWARLRTALWRNMVYYAVYILVMVLLLIILIVRGEVQGDLQSWCIAASNAWGLLVLTLLMGFGLVAVPRHFWKLADPSSQLRELYVSAVEKDETRHGCLFELQDAISEARAKLVAHAEEDEDVSPASSAQQLRQTAFSTLAHVAERCEQLHRDLSGSKRAVLGRGAPLSFKKKSHARSREVTRHTSEEVAVGSSSVATSSGSAIRPLNSSRGEAASHRISSDNSGTSPLHQPLSLTSLVQTHQNLKASAVEARRASCCFDGHVERCIFFEDLAQESFAAAAELMGGAPHEGPTSGYCRRVCVLMNKCWHRILILWLCQLRSRVFRWLGYASCVLSGVIVLGQLTMFVDQWNLSMLSLLFREDMGPVVTQVFAGLPLFYMTYTAYFSIFRLKIAGWYGLYGNHNTDTGSLLWCASILARLAAPLSYHFLLLVRLEGTSFQDFMGQMNVVPALGESFNQVFPCLIALLCTCNIFNFLSRFLRCLTLGGMDFELGTGDDEEERVAEGRQLVEQERRRRAEGHVDDTMELEGRSLPLVMVAPAG
eukprot:TRINITY_DN59492_c0_g1_i1.p1 TRINITY_DN59492_c0_g1~~TRINITY_DN59492_c0_g1_i1.p1  ORF type:complete len:663 (+),score=96.66 TRINITY_DN59492_c0_g1_i1:39-1991(+)